MKNSTGATSSMVSPFTSAGGLGNGCARLARETASSSSGRNPQERSIREDKTFALTVHDEADIRPPCCCRSEASRG
jgi:hypothetical protein